ncbi:DUF257 domain-containing protein [Thermococcus argininiproducens]|uniref:DUF257 domain-containing protein n=2 Tax=Thermococcus argininiproducens TaxID=2866384 RepID=A0A9E7MCQ4_9EURY|nr:DUF257 domain-containing protein [Thermococcus argininiproducens]
MWEVFTKLNPGEVVLVEYSSKVNPLPVFAEIIKWANARGYQILITDLLNRLELCLRYMKIGKSECKALEKAKVVEIGYREPPEVNVVKFINGDRELPALLSEYKKVYEKLVSEKFTVAFLLGVERYVILRRNDAIKLVSILGAFVGDTRRIAFYFVNKDILEGIIPNPLTMLEELATTIIELEKERGRIRLCITKALNPELDGQEIVI